MANSIICRGAEAWILFVAFWEPYKGLYIGPAKSYDRYMRDIQPLKIHDL